MRSRRQTETLVARVAGYLAQQPGPFRIDTRTGIEGLWQPDTALLYGLQDVGGLDTGSEAQSARSAGSA